MTMAYVLVILWLTLFSAGLWLRVRREHANVLRLKALLNANYGKWGGGRRAEGEGSGSSSLEMQYPGAMLVTPEVDEHPWVPIATSRRMTKAEQARYDADVAAMGDGKHFYCDTDSYVAATGPVPAPLEPHGRHVIGGTFTPPKFVRRNGQISFLREDEEVVHLADGGIRVVSRGAK